MMEKEMNDQNETSEEGCKAEVDNISEGIADEVDEEQSENMSTEATEMDTEKFSGSDMLRIKDEPKEDINDSTEEFSDDKDDLVSESDNIKDDLVSESDNIKEDLENIECKDEGEVKEEMGFGGLNPMEATATLLILSKIAYMSKKAWNSGGGEELGTAGNLSPLPGGLPSAWLHMMAEKAAGLASHDQGSLFPLPLSPYWPFGKIPLGGDIENGLSGLYAGHHGPRPEPSSSASPPTGGGINAAHFAGFPPHSSPSMLVVPQPINASKVGGLGDGGFGLHHHHHLNGGARKYHCKMCPQVFGSKADLQLHTQVHMREPKPYKCTQCSKSFANSSYLSQHMRIHLGIKPYRCEICQRKFTQLSHLQQHIRTHTGDKPYKCRHPGCTKAFSQLSNLQSHSRCHQTDKPYKCNSCYKCFHDETSLLEHIPKHKDSKHLKTHICSYCGKSYTQETYLAKHMQKHSDRSDKRAPIVANGTSTTPVSMNQLSGLGGSPTDHYWPKMDAYGYGHQLMDQRLHDPRDYDPRGLAGSSAASSLHQGLMGAEELRHHSSSTGSAQLSTSWGEHSSPSPHSSSKAGGSSAFSPLQSAAAGMSPAGFGMSAAHRGYASFYDPISFAAQTQSQKLNFGESNGVGGGAGVNSNSTFSGPQLLSLSKIKNYAHNPHNDGLFKSLSSLAGDKAAMGQLGAAQ